jgi:hypothetical protein
MHSDIPPNPLANRATLGCSAIRGGSEGSEGGIGEALEPLRYFFYCAGYAGYDFIYLFASDY